MTNTPQQEPRSSIENESGVRIGLSRVQGALSDGSDPAQYEYVFRQGSEKVGVLASVGVKIAFSVNRGGSGPTPWT